LRKLPGKWSFTLRIYKYCEILGYREWNELEGEGYLAASLNELIFARIQAVSSWRQQ